MCYQPLPMRATTMREAEIQEEGVRQGQGVSLDLFKIIISCANLTGAVPVCEEEESQHGKL